MARYTALQAFFVLGALIGAAEGRFDCTVYQEVCLDFGHSFAYGDCEATVEANTGPGLNNMECRELHLTRAAGALSNATHCEHASEFTGYNGCEGEILLRPPGSSDASSVSSFGLMALVISLIAAGAQM